MYEQPYVVYRHHDPDITIPCSNAHDLLIVIFTFPLTAYHGIVNLKSRCLSPGRRFALTRDTLNAQRTERLMGGDDRVEFVRIEPVLGGQRGFVGCVEREIAAVVDEEPMLSRKGGSEWIEC